ncbi:50S ribosomal protein L2 [Candidatus Berkelbacteria bacterium]|nr:50S ribosomal protein L2 [Candidatus Berkelbacteria bacterium]
MNKVKRVKPNTAARRNLSYVDFSVLTKKEPEKSLTFPLKRYSGRNRQGQISVRHKGGGAKRLYRLMDFKQQKLDVFFKVLALEYDPNRSGFIALVEEKENPGKKSYILASKNLKVGDEIITSENAEIKEGNRLKLKNIPVGMDIYNIELKPGRGGQIVRSAGTSAVVLAKEGKYVTLKMPSGERRLVLAENFASLGQVSNPAHSLVRIGKAGRKRKMGIRPTVRGKAMHPAAHPHGGGEGVNPIGLKYPKTPWGKPARGVKTRRNKRTDKFIVKRRK